MKFALVAATFLIGNFLQAAQPPNAGHFKGLAFSSALDRHAVEIEGGNLVKCQVPPGITSDLNRCEVENGSLTVAGTEWNALTVKFSKAAVLVTSGKYPAHTYYFFGTADLQIGSKAVATPVKVILSIEDGSPDRARGFIDLPEQYARTSFEAYLVP